MDEESDPLQKERFLHNSLSNSLLSTYVPFPSSTDLLKTLEHGEGSFLITAPSGTGKSSLLAHFAQSLKTASAAAPSSPSSPSSSSDTFVLMYFVGQSSRTAHYANLLRHVMTELKVWIGTDEPLPDSTAAIVREFPNWMALANKRPKAKLYIILDGLNQLQDTDKALDLAWLPQLFPSNVRFIVSSTPDSKVAAVLQARGWSQSDMPCMQKEETRQLAVSYLQNFGKELEPERLDAIVTAPQTMCPLFLKMLLDELRTVGEFRKLGQQISDLLKCSDVVELYAAILVRMEVMFNMPTDSADEPHTGLVSRVMSYIYAARYGISETELLGVLGLDRVAVNPLLIALQESLMSTSGLLVFHHTALQVAVQRRYLPNYNVQSRVHKELAAYFTNMGSFNPRRTSELPWHLMRSGDIEGLFAFLTDIPSFKMMQRSDFSKLELATYWREAGLDRAKELYEKSLLAYFAKPRNQRPKTAGPPKTTSGSALEPHHDHQHQQQQQQQHQYQHDWLVHHHHHHDEEDESILDSSLVRMVADALHEWAVYGGAEFFYRWALALSLQLNVTAAHVKANEGEVCITTESMWEVLPKLTERQAKNMIAIAKNFGQMYSHMSNAKSANILLHRILPVVERFYGTDDNEVAEILDGVGWNLILLRQLNGKDGAIYAFRRALHIKMQPVFAQFKDLKRVDMSDCSTTEKSWLDVLCAALDTIRDRDALAVVSKTISVTINRMAVAYANMCEFAVAESLLLQSLCLREYVYGTNHPNVALTSADLGNLYMRQRNHSKNPERQKLLDDVYNYKDVSVA